MPSKEIRPPGAIAAERKRGEEIHRRDKKVPPEFPSPRDLSALPPRRRVLEPVLLIFVWEGYSRGMTGCNATAFFAEVVSKKAFSCCSLFLLFILVPRDLAPKKR